MPVTRVVAVLALALAASTARAQAPAPFQLQTFEPSAPGDVLFSARDAGGLDRGPAGALVLSWAAGPLVLRQDGAEIPGGRLVHRQTWGWAVASLPVAGLALVDLAVPVALHQTGSQPYPDLAKVASSGLGDLRLGVRVPVLQHPGYALALAARAWLPTGAEAAFASDGKAAFEPGLVASGERGAIAWSGGLGWLIRPAKDVGYAKVGSALTYNAGAAWRLGAFRAGPELYGRIGLDGATSPAEALLGGHWTSGEWDLGVAFGTGLDKAAGAAPQRLLAQVAWLPRAGAAAEQAAARAAADRAAAEKAAAQAAEDLARRQAADAQAAADRATAEQAAILQATAAQAAAAKEAADRAAADRAAAEAAAAQAAADRAATDAANAKLVKVTEQKIEILQSIQFEIDKDVIRAESEPILQAVASVLAAHAEIAKVRVEGHTDNLGPEDLNLRLSDKRAAAVRRWLVEKGGVDAGRLEAKGFGPTQPIAPNTSREGRAKNRRVDFKILP